MCLQWLLFHLAMAMVISIIILSIFSMAKFIFIFILSILQWPSLSLSLSYISCDGHLFLYLNLIYLAVAIFIFILFFLKWPSLFLSLSDLSCNGHLYIFILFYLWLQAFPLSFQLSGCLQWPSKAPTKKGIAFCPIIYREYFYHPLGKF